MALTLKHQNNKTKLTKALYFLVLLIVILLTLLVQSYKDHYYYNQGLNQAKQSASHFVQSINAMRQYYSDAAVAKITNSNLGFHTSHDYKNHKMAIPNPATATIETCLMLKKSNENFLRCGLFSRFPFPVRDINLGLNDEYQQRALDAFDRGKDDYYEVLKENNEEILMYSTAITMEKSCIDCHNNHPLSPKKNWQEGDVRGGVGIAMKLSITCDYILESIIAAVTLLIVLLLTYIYWLKRETITLHFQAKADQDDTGLINRQTFDNIWNTLYTELSASDRPHLLITHLCITNADELLDIGDDYIVEQLGHLSKKLHQLTTPEVKAIARYNKTTIAIVCSVKEKVWVQEWMNQLSDQCRALIDAQDTQLAINAVHCNPSQIINHRAIDNALSNKTDQSLNHFDLIEL